jgi:tetratricopeptide (TPR) repeat protein
MTDPHRVEELRRRVQQDPASIAFAALAEEYRKLGRFTDAVETCRLGLGRHPRYVSARVTLARALSELGDDAAASSEFEQVLKGAPENLLARKGLAQILRRGGDLSGALDQLRLARGVAPQDPELPEAIWSIEQALKAARAPEAPRSAEQTAVERHLTALESLLTAIQRAKVTPVPTSSEAS